MSGASKLNAPVTSLPGMIEQCKSVLNAGGTVYLGEIHVEADARNICMEVLKARCVQYFCIEYNEPSGTNATRAGIAGYVEGRDQITNGQLNRRPQVPMVNVVKVALQDENCSIVCFDNSERREGRKAVHTNSTVRQYHMREKISECRAKINMVGRGVLVLVGSAHLVDVRDKDIWPALQKIVYSGYSFVFGRFNNCYMVWQLS